MECSIDSWYERPAAISQRELTRQPPQKDNTTMNKIKFDSAAFQQGIAEASELASSGKLKGPRARKSSKDDGFNLVVIAVGNLHISDDRMPARLAIVANWRRLTGTQRTALKIGWQTETPEGAPTADPAVIARELGV